ncbi:MAG: GNAT family N-acetyltransferase [Pseudomonadota bacterium]
MSARAALHKAHADDLERLIPMVIAFHEEEGLTVDDAHLRRAVIPLLSGSPHGEIFLAGPRMSPVGYLVSCYGWSLEFGGLDAYLDEFYLRKSVRGRGLAGDVLHELSQYLAGKGVMALSLEVYQKNAPAIQAYEKFGFEHRTEYGMMTRMLQ